MMTIGSRATRNRPPIHLVRRSRKQSPWRVLCVLGAFAVKVLACINRQDAKSAKKSAKKNSFQAATDFRVSSTGREILRKQNDRRRRTVELAQQPDARCSWIRDSFFRFEPPDDRSNTLRAARPTSSDGRHDLRQSH